MRILTCLILGVGLMALLLSLLSAGATAASPEDVTCQVLSEGYPTIQSAVDDPICEVIIVGQGVFYETITISRSLSIQGQGMNDTSVKNGAGGGTVFSIMQGITVTLANLAIENGNGGVANYGSTVTIENSLIANNMNSANGGGIANGSRYLNQEVFEGRLNLVDSIVRNNVARSGGGIYNSGGRVLIEDSVVEGNHADSGGGIRNAAFWVAPCGGFRGSLSVTRSLINNNSASGSGGGILSFDAESLQIEDSTLSGNSAESGGGIYNHGGDAAVKNSTLDGNEAASGAGIYTDFDFSVGRTCSLRTHLLLDNSTLSGNLATGYGGGIFNGGGGVLISSSTFSSNGADSGGGGVYSVWDNDEPCTFGDCSKHTITATHSIVANSLGGGECLNGGDAVFGDGGYNIVEDGACISAPSSFSGDPLLDSLGFNGGATATHALLAGSPAIDAGDHTNCPGTDQRGYLRPVDGDGDGLAICDIGAYEYIDITNFVHMPVLFR